METESSEVSSNSYIKEIETKDKTSIVDEGLNVVLRPLFFSQTEADEILQQLIAEIIDYGQDKILSKYNTEKRDIQRQQVSYGDKDLVHRFCGKLMEINIWTPALSKLRFHIEKALGVRYNFCVVNWRNDGHVRMGSRTNIENELEPGISLIRMSFGPTRKFLFVHRYSHDPKEKSILREPQFWVYKVTLPSGSLIEMKGQTDGFWYVDLPANADAKKDSRVSVSFMMMKSSRNVLFKDKGTTEYAIRTLNYDLLPRKTTLGASKECKKLQERGRIQELQAKVAEQQQGSSESGLAQRECRMLQKTNNEYAAKRKKILSRAQSVPITILSSPLLSSSHTRRSCSVERASTISISSWESSDMPTGSTEDSYDNELNIIM